MSEEVHIVRRRFTFVDGSRQHQIVAAYGDGTTAKKEMQEVIQDTNALLHSQLVEPATGNSAMPLGVSLGQALRMLGIEKLGCEVVKVEIRGNIRQAPPGLIIQ